MLFYYYFKKLSKYFFPLYNEEHSSPSVFRKLFSQRRQKIGGERHDPGPDRLLLLCAFIYYKEAVYLLMGFLGLYRMGFWTACFFDKGWFDSSESAGDDLHCGLISAVGL